MEGWGMSDESQTGCTELASLPERGRLLLALYEGALGFLEHATRAHERRDFERFAYFVERAQNVIRELSLTLDHDRARELATMLSRLYEFMMFRLTEASRTRDLEVVREETRRLAQIYDSYRQAIAGLGVRGAGPDVNAGARGTHAQDAHGTR